MYLRWPSWVKNGYGGRSTGTSVVPQIADDFGAPRKSAEVGHVRTISAAYGLAKSGSRHRFQYKAGRARLVYGWVQRSRCARHEPLPTRFNRRVLCRA